MSAKSRYLQIRISPAKKAALRRRADMAGQDMSSYVLSRVLPDAALRFAGVIERLSEERDRRFALAELNDLLASLPPAELQAAVEEADLCELPPFVQNYVAAMVEQAAHLGGVPAPAWTRDVEALEKPWFATPLGGLRAHLLRASPVPFRRRNLFVDSALGDRV